MSMKRREFLRALAGSAVLTALPGTTRRAVAAGTGASGSADSGAVPWRNWSGYLHATPGTRLSPAGPEELAEALRRAPAPVRAVGASHSFSPLVPTDATLISLRRMSGMVSRDPQAGEATFGGGARLGDIARTLGSETGQALINMPDIDDQTLAGAIATATHGTGRELGALHTQVRRLTLVTPRGAVLTCGRDRNPELFEAARVSLGALGVVSEVTLATIPAYALRRRNVALPLDEALSRIDDLARENRTAEMFYITWSGYALVTTTDPWQGELSGRPPGEDNDKEGLMTLRRMAEWLGWWPWLRRRLLASELSGMPEEVYSDQWWRIYPYQRQVRFNEIEYHLPAEEGPAALREVVDLIESRFPEVWFPLEMRFIAADDAWLSPFHGRPSISIAVHRYHKEDPLPLFHAVEPIFRRHGGRPHWGKMHFLGYPELKGLYPCLDEFIELRDELDPEGRLLNDHLRRLFGKA